MNQFQKILEMIHNSSYDKESFRCLNINTKALNNIISYSKKNKMDSIQLLTMNMIWNDFTLENSDQIIYRINNIKWVGKLLKSQIYKDTYKKYNSILKDIKYFPIPYDTTKTAFIHFENSWNMPRTYGGKRTHEGTDLMSSNNVRGYFPVISASDGIVEQKGWLEKGGYRIGIRSENGVYFYYAHLASYREGLEIGQKIKAGEILGYMGDTGYSKIEGTTGNFDVHLHFGIYINENGLEQSLNPYWILKYIENRKIKFTPHSN